MNPLDPLGIAGSTPIARRDLLRAAGAAAAFAAWPSGPPPLTIPIRPMARYEDMTLARLAHRIRARELTALEVVEHHLRRIAEVNPLLNAVVAQRAEEALEEARAIDRRLTAGESTGPLAGVPFTIKDSFDTRGVVSTAGTPGRAGHVPERDATVVARLRAAGAILLGKTNTPEFTMSFETSNAVYGRTNNPYDPERTPGGSSGGAVAIIAAGGAPFDIGTDTGGSIRYPAHCCGIVGLKPTAGRVSRSGHALDAADHVEGLTQVGPLARHVEDLDLILRIIMGPDGEDFTVAPVPLADYRAVDVRGMRVAFFTDDGNVTPDAPIVDAVRWAAASLADAGAEVREARPPGVEGSARLWSAVAGTDWGWLSRRVRAAGTEESPLLMRGASAQALGAGRYGEILEEWNRYRIEMLRFMDRYDAVLSPIAPGPAPRHGETRSPGAYTMAHNLTGWPAAVVRAGATPEGLPVGVQIAARPWREDVALALAATLEALSPDWPRPAL
jgi:amidase